MNVIPNLPILALSLQAALSAATVITIDAPGAISTAAVGINNAGVIVGSYQDANYVFHGFLIDAAGVMTTFDAPGAGTASGEGTVPRAINEAGVITGSYTDADVQTHGFIRSAAGSFTSFDGRYSLRGTFPVSINSAGYTAGSVTAADNVPHAFVRTPSGEMINFVPLDAVRSGVSAINDYDVVTGSASIDLNSVALGFVCSPACTSFQTPGSSGANGTYPTAINASGVIIGHSLDDNLYAHGFLRSASGEFTMFDAPGTTNSSSPYGTFPLSINGEGTIVGYDETITPVWYYSHGFVRIPDGGMETFEVPDAGSNKLQGTGAASINDSGEVVGSYTDSSGAGHGFLITP